VRAAQAPPWHADTAVLSCDSSALMRARSRRTVASLLLGTSSNAGSMVSGRHELDTSFAGAAAAGLRQHQPHVHLVWGLGAGGAWQRAATHAGRQHPLPQKPTHPLAVTVAGRDASSLRPGGDLASGRRAVPAGAGIARIDDPSPMRRQSCGTRHPCPLLTGSIHQRNILHCINHFTNAAGHQGV